MKLTRRGFLKRAVVVAGAVALPTPVAAPPPPAEPHADPLVITSPWGVIPPRTVTGAVTCSTSNVMHFDWGPLLHTVPPTLYGDTTNAQRRLRDAQAPTGSWAELERRITQLNRDDAGEEWEWERRESAW